MTNALNNRRKFLGHASRFAIGVIGAQLIPHAVAQQCSPTTSDLEGPFYLPGAPRRIQLAAADEAGERIVVRGKVLAADCRKTIKGVLLDIWQADANGQYHDRAESHRLRGKMLTDGKGNYEFSSIVPGRYKMGGAFRPAHIHFTVTHPDFEPLTTQLYFKGDPYLPPNDPCGARCKSNDANRIVELARTQIAGKPGFATTFNIILK